MPSITFVYNSKTLTVVNAMNFIGSSQKLSAAVLISRLLIHFHGNKILIAGQVELAFAISVISNI